MAVKIQMDKDSAKFFVRPPKDSTKKAIYMDAVNRAYGDMSRHTLHYKDPKYQGDSNRAKQSRQALRDKIAGLLKREEGTMLKASNQAKFDGWHKRMCEEITKIFTSLDEDGIRPIDLTPDCASKEERKATFSYGQAQKVLNMTIKYVYMFYQYFYAYGKNKDYKTELDKFQKIKTYLHTPVDSYVVDAATDKNGSYGLRCDKPKFAWSQLSYVEYMGFQNQIREQLLNKSCPFEWELQNYPFNKNDDRGL